jgi:hypothetical protein
MLLSISNNITQAAYFPTITALLRAEEFSRLNIVMLGMART